MYHQVIKNTVMEIAAQENNKITKALKSIHETRWVGSTTFTSMKECLAVLNLNSENSGWYNPTAVRINGLTGWFMINQNGCIFFESRIIKQSDNLFTIEHLTNQGFNEFEQTYNS